MMESEQEDDFLFVFTEEASLDTSLISVMSAIRVDGVLPSMSMDYIQLHFESKKKSGGGDIVQSHDFRSKGFVIFVYETSEVVKEVLKRPQVIDGHHLKVSRYEEHIPAQETDIVQEKLEKPRTVSVRGVPTTFSTEIVTYYFENKRRSKGGPVEGVTKSLEEDVFFVKFDNPEDAARVASHEHILEGRKLQVCIYTPPQMIPDRLLVRGLPDVSVGEELKLYMEARSDTDVDSILYGDGGVAVVIFAGNIDIQKLQEGFKKRQFKNVTLEVEPIPCMCTIQVYNLPEKPSPSEDMLRNYFESEHSSGGGEVTRVQIDEKRNYALITFKDATAASKALSRSHTIQGKKVELLPFYTCLGPTGGRSSPPVKIPGKQSLSETARQKIVHLKGIHELWQEFDSLLQQHHACFIEACSTESVYIECSLTQDTAGVRQLAAAWTQDAKNAVEDYLSKITIEEVMVMSKVFSETGATIRDLAERAGAFIKYDSTQGLLFLITKEASTDLVTDIKKTFAEAEEMLNRKSRERCEDFPLEVRTYDFFVKNHVKMKEIQETHSKLKVCYDHQRKMLRLTGSEAEIEEVKKFCQRIAICQHMWDNEATRELFRHPEAQKVIQTVCRESDPEGDVEFTEDGVVIYSLDKNKMGTMKETCLGHVRREKIVLSEEFGEACKTDKWKKFKEKFQQLGKGTVLIKEEQTNLIVVGVGSKFNICYEEAKKFFQENVFLKRTFFIEDEDLAPLYKYSIQDYVASNMKLTAKEVLLGKGCLSITGNMLEISAFERAMESLNTKKTLKEKTFNEPSLFRFLKSSEGKRERKDIEGRLKCKIRIPSEQSLTSAQGSGSLQSGDQGPTQTTGATGGSPPSDGQQRQTRKFADPQTQTKPDKKPDSLPAKPRIFLNPMSDITKEEHNVLVNSSNRTLDMSKGQVSRDLLRVGGPQLQEECKTKYPNGINFGEIAVTGKGGPKGLFCKNIFHCCLKEEKDKKKIEKIIKETTIKCLDKANEMGHSSIGFPAIGTGTLKFPPRTVAEAMFKAIIKFGRQNPDCSVNDVVIILHKKDQEVKKAFQEVKEEYTAVTEDVASDLQTNPNLKGSKSYSFFEETSRPLTLVFVGLDEGVTDQAAAALLDVYKAAIRKHSVDAPFLQYWDDFHVSQLVHACKVAMVDLTFNFELDRIVLGGFTTDIDRVPYSTIMKEAEEYLQQKKFVHLISKQVRWNWVEVDMTGKRLIPYDDTNNYMIEMNYRDGKPSVFVYDTNNQGFMIRFHTMDEIPELLPNTEDQEDSVEVFRHDLIHDVPNAPLPPHWTPMGNDDLFAEVPLKEDSSDYTRTANLFRTSYGQPHLVIEKIARIQNPTLYRQYMAKMMELKNSLPENALVERKSLWHGTKSDCVTSIVSLGFNRSYSWQKDQDNAYGDGVYFATSAQYAARQEYAAADGLGSRHVFLCRVLVGQYTQGARGMRFLPEIPNSRGRCYNSAVDDQADPTMFVIFNDTQAYPKYLIVFK
ncbi:poly [ADP-ribose] polymerase 14-like [Pomacea canaliculata]|uniref:poly [ADP-ribose] polymerase 14-like n=1 Tax=Pomacea canaliculata TaxID=400727 RepID=UPI000D729501|nr:poly [ADP-ribose] polymerase 14-like [Pomacea canaliculata]XP_025093183.1 poly [ADP-ribose] polymerase 14-like [Pomacea canaliculata]